MRRRKNLKGTEKSNDAGTSGGAGPSKPEEAGSSKMEEKGQSAESVDRDVLDLQDGSSDEIESSPSPGPSVKKPEPPRATALKKDRPRRMTLLPPKTRPSRMTLLPPRNPGSMKFIPTARVGPIDWRLDLESSHESSSTGHSGSATDRALQARVSSGPPIPRDRHPRYDPPPNSKARTRVLLTPDRLTPPGLPATRMLRTPDGSPEMGARRALRMPSRKCKRMRTARRQLRQQQLAKSVSYLSDTSSSSLESIGLDSSGDESSDDVPNPKVTRKKTNSTV